MTNMMKKLLSLATLAYCTGAFMHKGSPSQRLATPVKSQQPAPPSLSGALLLLRTRPPLQPTGLFAACNLKLAELSLHDWEWRRSVLDRVVPFSSDEQTVRGAVGWLDRLIAEEKLRAELVVYRGGALIRPVDLSRELAQPIDGPLGAMERGATALVNALASPDALPELAASERQRATTLRTSFEATAIDTTAAEFARARALLERGALMRPRDVDGPSALKSAEQFFEGVIEHEVWRASQLQEVRPMAAAPSSLVGGVERVATGLARAPLVMFELLSAVTRDLAEATAATSDHREDAAAAYRAELEAEAKLLMDQLEGRS